MEDHPRRSRTGLIAAVLAAVLVVGGAAAVIFWPAREEPAEATPASATTRPPTPFESSLARLEAQAVALTEGDEKGWLAAVDPKQPKLVAAFRTIYRNLRALEIGHAEYHASPHVDRSAEGTVRVNAYLGYCFAGVTCPTWRSAAHAGPPKLAQELVFTLRAGQYVITKLTSDKDGFLSQPPWEKQQLFVARGKRVVIAAPSSQRKHLKRFLSVAEKAAPVADRYATMIGNEQRSRYRIYLADDKAWKSWFGGGRRSWAIGYARPLNAAGTDVVLRMSKVLKERDVSIIVRHELAHVATLAGLSTRHTDDDQWLVEGIADYIGEHSKKPQDTYSRYALSEFYRKRGAPKSIAMPSLTDKSDEVTVGALYAMGHYASACMAAEYGEAKLMKFADLVLRKGEKPDQAARAAYRKPFKTVDKACLKWIRSRV